MSHANVAVEGIVRTRLCAPAAMSQMTQDDPHLENRRVGSSSQTLAGEAVVDDSNDLDQRQRVIIDLNQLCIALKFETRNSNLGTCLRLGRAMHNPRFLSSNATPLDSIAIVDALLGKPGGFA